MIKKIKNILINVFGDGFFGLERDNTTQIDISKDNKKPVDNYIRYGSAIGESSLYSAYSQPSSIGSCAIFSNATGQNNVAIGYKSIKTEI